MCCTYFTRHQEEVAKHDPPCGCSGLCHHTAHKSC
jgi:hypothetical protein